MLSSAMVGDRGASRRVTDFLVIDLPTIVDEFAEDFESIPALFPEREDYRILVTSGRLVAASSVIGQLVDVDTVVLLGIDLDLHHPPE
jgi:hypothetical protein